jgi:D-sedoheptulose 7-phosphate isomerase
MSLAEFITTYKAGFIDAIEKIDSAQIANSANHLRVAFETGKRIFIAGNGGSAATASHMACDLAKTTLGKGNTLPVKRIKAIALTDNMPLLTAWGNDVGYDCVFAEQLHNLAEPGDVLVVISASGNSPNILSAIHAAQTIGMHTVGWFGFEGGKAAPLVDCAVVVRNSHYGYVEDAHSVLVHLVTDYLKKSVQAERAEQV